MNANTAPKLMRRKLMSAKVIVLDEQGKILLLEEPRKSYLALPGGTGQMHESPRQTAIREVKEETGLDVILQALLCVDYEDDGGIEHLNFTFQARKADPSQEVCFPDGEASGHRYVEFEEAKPLVNPRSAERFIQCMDAIKTGIPLYLENGTKAFA